MILRATILRELKIHFRSAWTYSLIFIFSLFITIILYVSGDVVGIGKYSNTAGTIMNLMGYFLPLITLVIGAFSLTMEKEDGSWLLLSTYPFSSISWITGKIMGNFIVLVTIMTSAFSIGGIVIYALQLSVSTDLILTLYLYALCLMVAFLALSVLIGVLSRNRWQALTICMAIWILFVLAWPTLLMSLLHYLPFRTSLLVLQVATFFNPVEITRIFFTMKMGGGHVFGPQYVDWVSWVQQPFSSLYFIGCMCVWLMITIFVSTFFVERSRYRG